MRLFALLPASVAVPNAQRTPPNPPNPPDQLGGILKGPAIPGGALGLSQQLDLTGRVLLENRQPPPEPVADEYSCHGKTGAGLTDAKGRFSIAAGRQQVARSSLATDLPDFSGRMRSAI